MYKRFKDTISSEWVKYLVVIVLAVALWIWLFGIVHAVQNYEKLEIFFVGSIKDYDFEDYAKEDLGIDGLRKVELNSVRPEDSAFFSKLSVVGIGSSDVLIVPESALANVPYLDSVVILEGIDAEPFEVDGVIYGVYLPERAKERLSKYFAFAEERYVVFVPSASVNGGKITTNSIKFVEWLVK